MIATNQPRNGMSDHSPNLIETEIQLWHFEFMDVINGNAGASLSCKLRGRNVQLSLFSVFLSKMDKSEIIQ